MLVLKSFFLRLKPKSALYFAIFPALLIAFFSHSLNQSFLYICTLAVVLYSISAIWLSYERTKNTGISCKICGYANCTLYYKSRRKRLREKTGSFACSSFDHAQYPDIYFCPECRNGFLSSLVKQPEAELEKTTHESYGDVVDESYIENLPYRYQTYSHFLKQYRPFFAGKKVLEIGCYYGAFHEKVRTEAKEYIGLEPSKHACQFLKQKHPEIQLINGPVESLDSKEEYVGYFDTIAMFDVIEHVIDPVQTLTQLRKFLKPGGHIFFSTINIESSFSIVLGPFWPWYMDMHYYYFSDRGYHTMLHRAGYFMKEHQHFPYVVSVKYFLTKVLTILGLRFKSVDQLKTEATIPIKLGDTVLIVGENAG